MMMVMMSAMLMVMTMLKKIMEKISTLLNLLDGVDRMKITVAIQWSYY